MSQQNTICLEIQSLAKKQNYCLVRLEDVSRPAYAQVGWFSRKKGSLNKVVAQGTIGMRHWKPVRMIVPTHFGQRVTYLADKDLKQAWDFVLDAWFEIPKEEREAITKEIKPVHSISSGEYPERRVVKGQFVYHDAIAEVVEKFHSPWNAVLITPDSWFDKKLQEAYNSKRSVEKEGTSDEPDTT